MELYYGRDTEIEQIFWGEREREREGESCFSQRECEREKEERGRFINLHINISSLKGQF